METKFVTVGEQRYKLRMVPAYYAQQFLERKAKGDFSDAETLFLMQYVEFNGAILETEELINAAVASWVELSQLTTAAYDFNFGFLTNWKFWRVPNTDGFIATEPKQISAFIHSIITNEYADLHQLKTCVSLHDAFEMHDSILTKAMNEYRYSKLKGVG